MKDQRNAQGLSTDPSGDRLGDNAMMLKNVVPTSPSNVAPRNGTSLIAHYIQPETGRFVYADGLMGGLGNGIMIVCTQQDESDDPKAAVGVYAFYPRACAPLYETITGYPLTPDVLNYFLTDLENNTEL